jgi:hypothetical protein
MRLHATRRAAIAQARGLGNPLWDLAGVPPSLDLRFAESKSLVDAVSGQQLITFARASDGTFVNSAGQIEIAGPNVPRFTHNPTTLESLGLLVEEQRTNSIRNNTMVGAVAGTPGTLPTNWNENLAGVSRSIIETGIEDGVNYIELRLQGTPTSGELVLQFDANTQTVATASSVWTGSFYARMTGGSLTNIIASSVRIREANAAGGLLNAHYQSFTPTSARLATQRSVGTATLGASAERVNLGLSLGLTVGQAIDITLRIGLPQLEQGAFVTSAIPTTGTAATRTADVVSITGANFSSWYRQNEGTVFAESSSFSNLSGSRVVSAIDDGSMSNRFQITFASGYTPNFAAVSTGTVSADLYASAPAQGFNTRFCTTYGVNDFVLSSNGGNSVTDTSGALPISVSTARLGVFQNNTGYLNGTIRRLTYWPQRLPNSTLQNITL